jgi:hypothetical protein
MAVNNIRATIRFIPTPAISTSVFLPIFAFIKLSFALKSASSFGSSPLSLTNHPKGMRLSVYCVPDASVRSLHTLGGIPIPNSNTFTPLFFAVIKCQNSCTNTNHMNIIIPITIVIIFSKKVKIIRIIFCKW